MNLAELSQSCRVELHSEEESTLHFGRISVHLPIEDLKEIASMFNPREKDNTHDEDVCSVLKSEKGKFIFTYRSIMFTLCGTALSQLALLIGKSMLSYEKLFSIPTKSL